jgi:hypothetical protein
VLVKTALCVEAAKRALSSCARLTAETRGGCPLGCSWISGAELPARVTDLDSGAAGQCLIDRDLAAAPQTSWSQGPPAALPEAPPEAPAEAPPEALPPADRLGRAAGWASRRAPERPNPAAAGAGDAESAEAAAAEKVVAASRRRAVGLLAAADDADAGAQARFEPGDEEEQEKEGERLSSRALAQATRAEEDAKAHGKRRTIASTKVRSRGSRGGGSSRAHPGGSALENENESDENDDAEEEEEEVRAPTRRTLRPPSPGPWCAAKHAHTSRLCACAPVALVLSPPPSPPPTPPPPTPPPATQAAAVASAAATDDWGLPRGVSRAELALQGYRAEGAGKAAAKEKAKAEEAAAAAAEASSDCTGVCEAQGLGPTGVWSTLLGEQCSGEEPRQQQNKKRRGRPRRDERTIRDGDGGAQLPLCLALLFKPPRLQGACVCPGMEPDPKLREGQ